jgi:beta-lactamase regulating signal transducer with metallopeptidase domain
MCRRGISSAGREWQDRLGQLAARLRLSRPVGLLESCLAEAPVVIGHARPVVLMPVGLLAGMLPGQIESILLHELAHIRRL